MRINYTFKPLSLLALALLLSSGCMEIQRPYQSYFILYNLNTPKKYEIKVSNVWKNKGKIKDKMLDGTNLEGEFVFNFHSIEQYDRRVNYRSLSADEFLSHGNVLNGTDSTIIKKKILINNNFPELFGYSNNAKVTPVGNAVVMIGDEKIIEMIFYQLNYSALSGSGIGKDNLGNIYRVYLVTETN